MLDDYLQEIGPQIHKLGFDCSVVAGGSYSYKYSLYRSLDEIRDIDLLIFFQTREDIVDFLTVHQQDLDKILHLDEAEKHFNREDLKLLTLGHADAIRYSGQNTLGQKISAKIISYDIFLEEKNTSISNRINIISEKDKRFYSHKTLVGQLVRIGVVNQRFHDDVCILGDPELFQIGSDYCLGVVADVCLTGKILQNSDKLDVDLIKKNLIKKIVFICEVSGYPEKWTDIIIRSDRLPYDFANYFSNQFPKIPLEKIKNYNHEEERYTVSIVSPVLGGSYEQAKLSIKNDSKIAEKRYLKISGPFSSNSKYGLAVYNNGERAFFKEMLNEYRFRGEIYGMITSSAYFDKLRSPIFTDPECQLVSYDWFPGDIVARQRLESISDVTFERLMDLELHKAEDHLNAYIRSRTEKETNKENVYESRIHDLYFGRLMGSRYVDYYQESIIRTKEKDIPFRAIESCPIKINGKKYPSLLNIIEKAKIILNPDNLGTDEIVCGLGDAHSGNVLCSNNLDSYIYIDYEFSGFHSPYLDIARQLYIDSAFDIYYSDVLPPKKRQAQVEVVDGCLEIRHDYFPDKLSSFIFKTKMEGILLPYRNYCRENKLSLTNNWKEILGLSLFCSGMLSRNISNFEKDNFILNIANSVESLDVDHYSHKFEKFK